FFQAEDGIRDRNVTGVQTCALPIFVTKNAILLVDYTNQLRRDGLSVRDALQQAGPVRLRPIVMTTVAMILGMLPSAIGRGDGSRSEERRVGKEWRARWGGGPDNGRK